MRFKQSLTILLYFISLFAYAAPFRNHPYKIKQPNGDIIPCFVSGDEFYNWIHDKDGYTIIQAEDGYFYYAILNGIELIPSKYMVQGISQLKSTSDVKRSIDPWLKLPDEVLKKRFEQRSGSLYKSNSISKAYSGSNFKNLVVYIRFSDDTEFETSRQTYDQLFNNSDSVGLYSYFAEVSYGKLKIESTAYPQCADPSTTNVSYQDSHPRGYFQKHNATSNSNGYQNDTERFERENSLIRDAVNWLNSNNQVNPSLNIDGDNDGNIDNVCFIIRGQCEGWNDLLWAHKGYYWKNDCNINGKKLQNYTLLPENQFDVRTICHEMFHVLGAPDLYHYKMGYLYPVASWDLMESGLGHMGAYMKWKYSGNKWIDTIPEITKTGTYTLNPLTSPTNNCFRIASPNSENEFFIVEYRKKEGLYESKLPGSGLLIYRINSDFIGNAGFDNSTCFDEVYIYRPDGTQIENGDPEKANYCQESGRTIINATTNPVPFLHDGLPGWLNITNITNAGATLSFSVQINSIDPPSDFKTKTTSNTRNELLWNSNSSNDEVIIATSTTDNIGRPFLGESYEVGSVLPRGGMVVYKGRDKSFVHTGLFPGCKYYYKVWSKNEKNVYSLAVQSVCTTKTATYQVKEGELFLNLSKEVMSLSAGINLEGTIDARDFKTMRDNMPMLEEIDLSKATIVSYSGTEGTDFVNKSAIYQPNSLPFSAFMKDWQGKKNLKSIVLPATLAEIDWSAFRDCDGLKTVVIPSRVVKIGGYVFMDNDGLASIEIPSSVASIGSGVFWNCSNLSSIKVFNPVPVDFIKTQSSNVFTGVNKTACTLYVPYGTKAAYHAADQWKDFANIVEMPNLAPTANAGADQTVDEGSSVSLDGTGSSDPDNNPITYSWTAPAGITLSSYTATKPTFTAPEVNADTKFTFTLMVNDGLANSQTDQVVVTVRQVNKVPLANAGVDQAIGEGSTVTLDGSLSADPDGQSLTYLWTAPAGITLSSSTSAKPTFTAPEVNADAKFTFTLVVNDGLANSQTDLVVVTVLQVIKVGVDLHESTEFKIFPNPTSGKLNIEVPGETGQSVMLSIFNIQGQEILCESKFESNPQIDLTSFVDGVYLLKIKTKGRIYSAKVIHRN